MTFASSFYYHVFMRRKGVYKPITDEYKEKFKDGLVDDFPGYIRKPLEGWLFHFAINPEQKFSGYTWKNFIESDFAKEVGLNVRDTFIVKKDLDSYMYSNRFFSKTNLVIEVLNFIVQTYAEEPECKDLENILLQGGHAYTVSHIGKAQVGLEKRVSDELKKASEEALNESSLLREAWHAFYCKDPDFEKTVSKSIDALETKIKNKYYPQDKKPSLGRYMDNMKTDQNIKHVGSNVDTDKKLFDICKNFADYRGQHTSGSGNVPTKEDAEFILHTSILVYHSV